jgi:hypothetical protein
MVNVVFGVTRDSKDLAEFIFSKIKDVETLTYEHVHTSIIEFSSIQQPVRKPRVKKTNTIPALVIIEKFGETTSGIIGTQLSDERVVDTITSFKAKYPSAKIKKNRSGDFGVSYSFSRSAFQECVNFFKEACLDARVVLTQSELSLSTKTKPNEFMKFCTDVWEKIDDYPNVSRHSSIVDQKAEIVKMWKEQHPEDTMGELTDID